MYGELKEKLSKRLSKHRYEHSVRVAETAYLLAQHYQSDDKKAYLAGLLHDCARDYCAETLQGYVEHEKIEVEPYELEYPVLLHAVVGAAVAQKDFGITDREVLDAIYRHTAGGKNMSLLAKIVFVADFIEPLRTGDKVRELFDIAFDNLDQAVYGKAKYMVEFSRKIDEELHPRIRETMEYYSC